MKALRNTRLGSKSGMTLVELLITVVIIGIIMAAAFPHFERAFEKASFNSAGRSIGSTLRYARSLAISDKEPYGVNFDTDEMTVTLFKDVGSPETYTFEGTDSVLRIDTLPHEFSYVYTDCEDNTIVFGRTGRAHFEGYGNIYTMAETENICGHYWLNVLASTGRVRTESYIY